MHETSEFFFLFFLLNMGRKPRLSDRRKTVEYASLCTIMGKIKIENNRSIQCE